MSFVLDCSIVIAAILPDERPAIALDLLTQAQANGAHAPAVWPLEVANSLLMAQKRKRIDEAYRLDMLVLMAEANVIIDPETPALAWFDISRLAQRHNLTAYDAAYLELALRLKLPLATLDQRLADAARAEGVQVLAG